MRFFLFSLLTISTASLLYASGQNIAPDAITRATTWNTFEGDLATLSDGQIAPNGQPFIWQNKGILVFSWNEVLPVERVRVYVGELANDYQVRTYVGGRLEDEGAARDPEGQRTTLIDDFSRTPNQWHDILLPPGIPADNIELSTLGSTVFYEVEIHLAGDATAVDHANWGQIKATRTKP